MPSKALVPYRKKKVYRKRNYKKKAVTRYRGTVARIPRALPLKPKSVCQKLVYHNSFHVVPGLDLNGNQQNWFFTIALNSPWPFIDGWNQHAITNNRQLSPNSAISPLNANHQPDVNTTAMPGLKDGYNLFHQYQNGVVVGSKVTISAQPTAPATTSPQQSGVLYAVKHAKANFGLADTSTITDIQKLPFRQMKRVAGINDDLNMAGSTSRNTGASIIVKHSTKKFNNIQSIRDNQRFQFKQATSLHPYGQNPEDSDFLTVGLVSGLNAMQGVDHTGATTTIQKKAPDLKLSFRIEMTVLFTEPLENLGEGTGNYSLPWDARMYGGIGYTMSRLYGLR